MKTKKNIGDFEVIENRRLSKAYSLLILSPKSDNGKLEFAPGQFVQIATPNNATYLRRPISVCFVDKTANTLWLLVRTAGPGTKMINAIQNGESLNIIYPLGNGFSIGSNVRQPLLVGGGVGVAPLLYLGHQLSEKNIRPTFLLGARSGDDLLLRNEFEKYGTVAISTEDGSLGEQGLVTTNSILSSEFDTIYCCGPMPMMKAVASIARKKGCDCEVSLENIMGCGIGACLCCVEKTVKGNLCVCTDGPVFNINQLLWQD